MQLPFPLALVAAFLVLPHTLSAQQAAHRAAAPQKVSRRVQALSLPFFDDFSGLGSQPDTLLWEPSPVLQNNYVPVLPPTQGVATLDGLDANRLLYRGIAGTNSGFDTLTSKPIDLSGRTNVRLSFWWQRGGVGGDSAGNPLAPTSAGRLLLEFDDGGGFWGPVVWSKRGTSKDSAFARAEVVIPASYLTSNFRFRFRAVGGPTDSFRAWNLDYVEIDPDRGTTPVRDVALSQALPPFLRRYTAMPIWQYVAASSSEIADSTGSTLSNLVLDPGVLPVPVSVNGTLTVEDQFGGVLNQETFLTRPFVVPSDSFGLPARGALRGALSAQPVPTTPEYKIITQQLVVVSGDPLASRQRNDTLRRRDVLEDYYAYDDGSAELFFRLHETDPSSAALAFDANTADQVAGVSIYFTYYDYARVPPFGRTLNVEVWADDPQQPGQPAATPLSRVSFALPDDAVLNGLGRWYHIWFTNPQPVNGRFYVGYSQPANAGFLNIGVDLNAGNLTKGKLFTRKNTPNSFGWAVQPRDGAVMIHPRMNNNGAVGLPEAAEAATFAVYPNPVSAAEGEVRLLGSFTAATLLDALGRPVRALPANAATLDVRDLAPGLYALRFHTPQGGATRRLVVTR